MDAGKIASEILKEAYGRELPTVRIYAALKKAGLKVTGYSDKVVTLRYNKNDVNLHVRESTDYKRYGWTLVESDIRDDRDEKAFQRDFIKAMKSAGVRVAFNGHRLEVKFKEITEDTADSSDFLEERMDSQSAKLIRTKYKADLDKNGVMQIRYGSEFIEHSIAIAKDAVDLIKLHDKRSWKGMSVWDTPELPVHEAIKYDKVLKLYFMDTGFFD